MFHSKRNRGLRICLAAIATVLFAVLLAAPQPCRAATMVPTPSGAQGSEVKIPETLTRSEVRDLLARLSDDEVRQVLIRQLDKVAAADEAAKQGSLEQSLMDMLPRARARLELTTAALPTLPEVGVNVEEALSQGQGLGRFAKILLYTALIFALGAAVEWGFRRMFTQFGAAPDSTVSPSVTARGFILCMRLVRDLLGITVFGVTAVALFFVFYEGAEPVRVFVGNLFWGIVFYRIIAALLRFAIAPRASWLRVPALSDANARSVYTQVMFVVGTIIVAYFGGTILARLGSNEGQDLALSIILTFAVLIIVSFVLWRNRRPVRVAIAGQLAADEGWVRRLAADNWYVFAVAFLLLMGGLAVVQRLLTGEGAGPRIIASIVILGLIPAVDWGLRALVCGVLRIPGPYAERALGFEEIAAEDAAPRAEGAAGVSADKRAYHDVAVKNLRIVLGVVVVVALSDVWELDLQSAAASGVGATLAGAMFDIIITLILASAAWGILRVAIRSAVPDEDGGEEEAEAGEIGGKGTTRLGTLVPLLGKFLMITLIVMVAMIILSELGVDIGPLIAGAGVVGLAVGFGAQTLVRDILSGLFFLLDDAFRVGEYVETGGIRGSVEHISIRSLRLRHHNGPLHTLPFGEIQSLTNYSRDWAIMKLEVRVPFDTDLEKVRKIIKKTGQELVADADLGPNFLQPLKSQGVHRMDDSAFIIRVKFMAKPGEQFVLRREVFRRIQEAFALNGIRFAPRRVIVDTGAAPVTPAVAASAAAAAAEATDRTDKAPDESVSDL